MLKARDDVHLANAEMLKASLVGGNCKYIVVRAKAITDTVKDMVLRAKDVVLKAKDVMVKSQA